MTREHGTETTTMEDHDKEDLRLARSALLEAVETPSTTLKDTEDDQTADDEVVPSSFLHLFASGNSRRQLREGLTLRDQKQLVFKAIQTFPKPLARRFFAALSEHVNVVIQSEAYVPDSAYPRDDDQVDDGSLIEVTPDAKSSQSLEFLNCATLCVKAYLDGLIAKKHGDHHSNKQPTHIKLSVIDEAFQIAQSLHDILLLLNSAGPDALEPQSNIVRLCESWWIHNGDNKEQLVLQALPLIVYSVLNEDTKTGIKRLFQMREAIPSVDFRCPASHDFKATLLHLASSPKILKLPEGKKLLSYLMHTEPQILRGLHKAIRAQIPVLRGNLLTSYGECYFRAWKEAPTPEIREGIESLVLHDLMHTAVHTARPNLLKSLLLVLEPFHNERKTPEVEKLLFRMYSGMLWRALSTTNGMIRVNATHIFAQVFPLRDASSMQTENALRKGIDALETLLQDPDPKVRVAASQAATQILPTYWDVLPSQEIRELLNLIIMEHASDRTSSAVRVAAVDAITGILDAPPSHGVLRPLLPVMGNLIHDRVEKVRLAVVRMLLKIKSIKGIKYYHVVPVSHLTGRLAAEASINLNGPVARALTGLVVNSFCPHGPNARSQDQVNRTIKLLMEEPVAASVFYNNLSGHVPVGVIEKLAANLFRCAHSAVREARREREVSTSEGRKRTRDDDDEDTVSASSLSVDSPLLKAENIVLMTNLIVTASTLWHSIAASRMQRPSNETSASVIVNALDGAAVLDLLSFFEGSLNDTMLTDNDDNGVDLDDRCSRATSAILSCAELLPSECVQGVVAHILGRLESLSDEEPPSINVTPYISRLCAMNMTDAVASSLATSIESSFEADFTLNFSSPEAGSRKRKSSRSGGKRNSAIVPGMPPRVALTAMSEILQGLDAESAMARGSIFASATASDAIEGALVRGTKYAERLLHPNGHRGINASESEIEYILQVCETYGRFTLHREATLNGEGHTSCDQAKALLQWTDAAVIPVLISDTGCDHIPFVDPDLSRISIEKSFDGRLSSPVPTGPPRRRSNRNTTPVRLEMSESDFDILATPQSSSQLSVTSRDVAYSLLQSCLILFSERLAVGAPDVDAIVEAALRWMVAFDESATYSRRRALCSGFSLLAFSLCKHSSSFTLLESLLVKYQEGEADDDTSPVTILVSKLLCARGQRKTVEVTVHCFLEAAHVLLSGEASTSTELPVSLEDLWTVRKGCVQSALKAVFDSKAGSIELARRIVASFDKRGLEVPRQSFYAKCLFVLCGADSSKFVPEIGNMVRGLDVGMIDAPQKVQIVLDELQVSLA